MRSTRMRLAALHNCRRVSGHRQTRRKPCTLDISTYTYREALRVKLRRPACTGACMKVRRRRLYSSRASESCIHEILIALVIYAECLSRYPFCFFSLRVLAWKPGSNGFARGLNDGIL